MKNTDIITYADFTEEDLKDGKDKQFIENVEQYYHGDYHINAVFIHKKSENFLRVFVIRGKY